MSLELLTACPICKGTHFSPHLQVTDHSVSHGTFAIVRCEKCSFLFTNPRPDEAQIGAYYDDDSYLSHHDDPDSALAKVYNAVRNFAVKEKINLLDKYDGNPQKKVLDIGCATGFFLSAVKQKNWETWGTEPDADARQIALKKNAGNVFPSVFDPALRDSRFTSVTMWHVLEHVHRLDETLSWIHHHLDSKGALFIAVPNPESYDAAAYGEYWAAYDVPRHLYHFTRSTMAKLLQHYGFSIVGTRCMLFDAYYVSLLSTKYKYGKNKPAEALVRGTLSNLKGYGTALHNANTSSLIYIVQKK